VTAGQKNNGEIMLTVTSYLVRFLYDCNKIYENTVFFIGVYKTLEECGYIMEQGYMTLKEVASLLRVSEQTVYKMVQENEIPAIKVGGTWRVPRGKLIEYLDKDMACKEQVIKAIQDRIKEIEKVKAYNHRRFNSIANIVCDAQILELQFCMTLLGGGVL